MYKLVDQEVLGRWDATAPCSRGTGGLMNGTEGYTSKPGQHWN